MKSKSLLLGLFLLSILFTSCDKTESNIDDTNVDTNVEEQNAAVDDIVESVFDEIDSSLSLDSELSTSASLKASSEETGCPTVTVELPEDGIYPLVVTFDYGTDNCEDRHGRLKRGKVIVTKTGPYWESGSERMVEFDDFYVNDNKVEGIRKFINEGQNIDLNWEFSIDVDITVQSTEDITWTRTSSKTRTLIAGADTPRYIWDDEFLVTGSASGESSEGYAVTREITTPLYRKRICRFPVSGVIEVVRSYNDDNVTSWLDYGDGECDYKATVTDESGNVAEITLGGRFRNK